uniref:Uncharacterized protein n=1 Tax=Oryza nivara TaxID=4536 RepID=A0A0E0FR21_ORYNI
MKAAGRGGGEAVAAQRLGGPLHRIQWEGSSRWSGIPATAVAIRRRRLINNTIIQTGSKGRKKAIYEGEEKRTVYRQIGGVEIKIWISPRVGNEAHHDCSGLSGRKLHYKVVTTVTSPYERIVALLPRYSSRQAIKFLGAHSIALLLSATLGTASSMSLCFLYGNVNQSRER